LSWPQYSCWHFVMCQFNAFKFYIANVRMYFFLNVHFHISLKQLKWKTILSTHFSVIVFHVLCIYMVLHGLHGHYTIYKCILHLHIQAYMVWLHPKALKHLEHDIDTTLTHHKHSQEYQWWSKSKKVKNLGERGGGGGIGGSFYTLVLFIEMLKFSKKLWKKMKNLVEYSEIFYEIFNFNSLFENMCWSQPITMVCINIQGSSKSYGSKYNWL